MKKLVIIMLGILLIGNLFAVEKAEKKIKPGKYSLVLENIELGSLDFVDANEISVKSDDGVKLKVSKSKIEITADEMIEIDLELPIASTYIFTSSEGAICTFNSESVNILGEDGEIVNFGVDGMLVIDDDDHVRIDEEGIFVENDTETISITSKGIQIQGGDEDVNLTGFWGSLLGSMVKGITSTAISFAIDNPEKIIKEVINENDKNITVNWGTSTDYETEKFEKTVPYKKGMKLGVINRNGKVKVDTWDKKEINIKATKKIGKSVKNFEQELADAQIVVNDKKDCLIQTKYKNPRSRVSVEYIIMVPKNMEVSEIKSTNGSLIINGTKNGAYTTSNGSIVINFIQGDFTLNSSNGSITAENAPGTFSARTSNASITVKDCANIRGLYTTNGSIQADIISMYNDLSIQTTNGTIRCNLANIDAMINARTSNGSIKIEDVDLDILKHTRSILNAEIGKGVHNLNLKTSNGKIKIGQEGRSL